MTKDERKKRRELMYAALLADRMNSAWSFAANEAPDFIVTDGNSRFGLEVRNIYYDEERVGGSPAARHESMRQCRIDTLRAAYEAVHRVPLVVKISGNLEVLDDESFIAAIERSGIHRRPPAHQEVISVGNETKVFLTRGLNRAEWYFVQDRAGWINTNAQDLINAAISYKAKKRKRYVENCGDDVRLLIVADEIMNSGKLRLTDGTFDHQGFSKIYLLNYPDAVAVLRAPR